MKYYDLLKQYVSNGHILDEYQFDAISRNNQLASGYLHSRGKIINSTGDYPPRKYEFNYLMRNENMFTKLGKDALVKLVDIDYEPTTILNVIFKYYISNLTSMDVDILIQKTHSPEIFGYLYNIKPYLFNSSVAKYGLLGMGLINKLNVDFTEPINIKIRIEDIHRLLMYERDNIEWIDAVVYDDIVGYFNKKEGFEINWKHIFKEYLDDETVELIIEILGLKINFYDKDLVIKTIEKNNRTDIIDAIINNADRVYSSYYREAAYRAMVKALSFYGKIYDFEDKSYVVIGVNDLNYYLDFDWSKDLGYSINNRIINYLTNRPDNYKPRLFKPKIKNLYIKWDFINEMLVFSLNQIKLID